jgi:hypothetical protein
MWLKQSSLPIGKWNVYLRAPPVYQKIVSNSKVKKLGIIADVFFGIKTGYNDYFILSKSTAKEWEIERRYVKPVVTSPKKIPSLVIHSNDLDEYLLLCHEQKRDLKGTNVLRYIEHGERLKVKIERTSNPVEVTLPNVPSVRGRDPWYDLPEFEIPPIIFQELYDIKTRALWNEAEAHARAPLYYCIPKDKADARIVVSFLNSSLSQLLLELYGRSYGGGVLDVKVYELKLLPVLDPSSMSAHEKKELWRTFVSLDKTIWERVEYEKKLESIKSKSDKDQKLLESQTHRDYEESLEKEREAQQELDDLIYDLLGLNHRERKQIEDGLAELQEIRRMRREV